MRKSVLCALAAMFANAGFLYGEGIDHVLFDFRSAKTAERWRINIYGKDAKGIKGGGSGKAEIVAGKNKGERALRLSSKDAGSYTFSVRETIEDGTWRNRKYFGIEVSYRGDGASSAMKLYADTPDGHYAIALRFDGKQTWQKEIYRSGWSRKGTPPLDWSKITRVYFGGGGSRAIEVRKIALVGGVKRIYLDEERLPSAVAMPSNTVPAIDGSLNDAAWSKAGRVNGLFLKDRKTPSAYPTEAMLLYKGSSLFIGARLKGEKPADIAARYKTDEAGNLWDDSCLEIYLDPGNSNRLQYKFIVNSLGTRMDLGGEGCRPIWSGKWQAAASVDKEDGWSLELAIDLESLDGAKAETGSFWGANFKRHVVSAKTGKFLEVSGWSQTHYGRPAGLGNLIFGPISETKIRVAHSELLKLDRYGFGYNCRLELENGAAEAVKVFADLALTPPNESTTEVAKKEIALRPRRETASALPFEYKQTRDGNHLLDLVLRDSKGRVAGVDQYRFVLTRPRELDYEKVMLWPEPQLWKPGTERWLLPASLTLSTTGKGDAFPSEHLSEKLQSRYGVSVKTGQGAAADLRLEYIEGGIKPDGFVLDVDASGARLQASTSRGMYYAVRALLDTARQSSFARPKAGILHVHCEDWPGIPTRVYMDFFISERYHRTPVTVGAYKRHIYDQIAGGRYNLYAIQISEHVRYDTHPELATRNSFTKAEMKEIIDFARKHYVDIAPGWNTPGHCGWLVGAHPELREDSDRKTLCTSNPAGMGILKDVAGELLELYQPKYFFMTGDEVSHGWNRVAKRTCKLCAGKPRNQLLLEHWSELARFFEQHQVKPVIFDDMLSVKWNGGPPYNCAAILPRLPRNLIIATWGAFPLSVPPENLRKLGFTPWWISTSFSAGKMDKFPAMWKGYDACGIAETTTWVWSNFTHFSHKRQCNYSTPSLHANAACCWKPGTAPTGHAPMIHSLGIHWSNVMQVPDWEARALSYKPISIASACNESTSDAQPGDGKGWMDLGPEHDLSSLPNGTMSVGGMPFNRPTTEKDCILLKQDQVSQPVKVGMKVLGFAFAHTAAATETQAKALHQRFFRKNTDPLAMPVAYYQVRYADSTTYSFPVRLGYDVHLWNCAPLARVMPGPSTYWMGLTAAQRRIDPNVPDACVWVMEWKNPFPAKTVQDVTFVSAGTEADVACLGMTAVE